MSNSTLRTISEIVTAATTPPREEFNAAKIALAPVVIDAPTILRRSATPADREDMLKALAEFEELLLIHSDFSIAHMASAAREKLEKAGIETCDDAHFRLFYLEQSGCSVTKKDFDYAVHYRIVSRLESKAGKILSRIRPVAIAEVERNLLSLAPTGDELAALYGVPSAAIYSPLFIALCVVRDELRADLNKPVSLRNGADRRVVLSQYFPEPL